MKRRSHHFRWALLILLLDSQHYAFGQEEKRGIPLNVSVFSEAWSMPSFELVKKPIHPGLYVGTEKNMKEGRHSRFFLSAGLGYYYHKNIQHGIFLNLNAGYAYQFGFGLYTGASLGVGVINTIYPTPTYKLKNGEYKKSPDWGKVSLMPNADLTVGYTFNRESKKPISIFTKYQVFLEYPYAPENTFPALPHTAFHIGTKFYPFTSH